MRRTLHVVHNGAPPVTEETAVILARELRAAEEIARGDETHTHGSLALPPAEE